MRQEEEKSEKLLIERLKNQEERALEELAEAYESEIFRIVRQIVKHLLPEEDIQEIVNDTFYQVWRHAANLDDEKGSVRAYLAASARNLTKNRLRTYKGSVFQVQDYDVVEISELYEIAEREERRRLVLEALNRLSEEEKEIFIRYYYFYQTTEEIADTLGIKQNTVKSKLKRGKKKLKKFLWKGEWNHEKKDYRFYGRPACGRSGENTGKAYREEKKGARLRGV